MKKNSDKKIKFTIYVLFIGIILFTILYILTRAQKTNYYDNFENTCWNNVVMVDNVLMWQNNCKGSPIDEGSGCQERQVLLTDNEIDYYLNKWKGSGREVPKECQQLIEEE